MMFSRKSQILWLSFLFTLFFSAGLNQINLNAQNSEGLFFWVYPNHPDAQPATSDYNATTNSNTLNALFTSFEVTGYHEAFPGVSDTSILYNAHSLSFDGGLEAFYQALQTTNLFDEIYLWGVDAITLGNLNKEGMVKDPELTCDTPLEFNDPYPALPPNATVFNTDWSIDDTDASCAWTITKGDPNIIIGFVDTEFYDDHPELIGKKLPDVNITPNAESQTIQEKCHHGTGTMADAVANPNNGQYIAGIGYNTRAAGYVIQTDSVLVSGRRACSPHRGADLWDGLWRAGFTDNRPIVNLSWSGIGTSAINTVDTPPFADMIATAAVELIINTGTLIVVGAGHKDRNTGVERESHSQFGDIPGYLIVGGVSITKRHHPTNSPSYAEIDMCAPSKDINSISFDDQFNPTVSSSGGDSHAAPYVAGAAALCLAVNPCLTPVELEIILKSTTDPIADVASFPGEVGTGYLNVYKAVLAASKKVNYTVTTTEIWEDAYPRMIEGNLTIASGGELTIKSTVAFPKNSKIIVQPGGRLIVKGGHLKNDCDSKYWKGIEVLGVSNSSQSPTSNQGFVELEDALIENAETAVSLYHRHNYDKGGGILYAKNSQFLNCQRGVGIAKYYNFLPQSGTPFRNLSFVNNCEFTIDAFFPFSIGGEHIMLDRTSKVGINKCKLTTNTEAFIDPGVSQTGLFATNATFKLRNTELSNLLYGVKAQNIKSTSTFEVTDNTFTDNFYGISVRAVDAFNVSTNTFKVGGFDGLVTGFDFYGRQVGVAVDRSTAFFIRGNTFSRSDILTANAEHTGIFVKNTNIGTTGSLSTDHNEIFGNSFQEMYRGNVANGENRGANLNFGGLQYFCNQNKDTYCTDFTVAEGSIAPTQISLDNRAIGNTFSHDDSCNPAGDFDNGGQLVDYHYFDGSPDAIEEPLYFGGINKITAPEGDCSEIKNPGPVKPGKDDEEIIKYPVKKQAYEAFRQQYFNLLDGGHRQVLKDLLNNMTTANITTVLQQLNQLSPYLSEDVLKLILNHTLISSNQKVYLLGANPEGIKGGSIQDDIENGGWFNVQQKQNLATASQTTTSRTTLENDLRQAQGEMQRITHALQHYYYMDEVEEGLDYDKQALWAYNNESLEGRLQSVDLRLQAGDIATATTELDAIMAMNMSATQADELAYFQKLKGLEITLFNSNRSYEEVTANERDLIKEVAFLSQNRSAAQAENWLSLISNEDYQEEPHWGGITALQASPPIIGAINNRQQAPKEYIKVHPNPSSNQFSFYYQLDKTMGQIQLNVYSITGQLVFKKQLDKEVNSFTWTPKTEQNGFYIYHLLGAEGTILQEGKLVYLPK